MTQDSDNLDLFGTAAPDPDPAVPFEDLEVSPGYDGGAGESDVDASTGPRVWSVSQVNRAVRALLERTLPPLWMSGEVANWTRARSGHCYFTLKDESSQIRCVLWRKEADRLPTDPDEGMTVRVFGYLTVYEVRGEYQFTVRSLEGEGAEGLWRLAFERLRQKLEGEGILAPERKRPVPRFPRTVGVVTSPTGAALHDVLTVLRRRAPWTRVVLRAARVQGEGAGADVARAIRLLGSSGLVQVLIVGRGGGSIEDLWAFNEEVVARAIADCPVPVISAVGHEVDVTISDLVADLRAPTPSAAAEAAVQDAASLRALLRTWEPRLAQGLARGVDRRRGALGVFRERMTGGLGRVLSQRRQRLSTLVGTLEALSPLATLRRGYAVPLDHQGSLLRRVDDFTPGLAFVLRVADGRVPCDVAAPGERETGD